MLLQSGRSIRHRGGGGEGGQEVERGGGRGGDVRERFVRDGFVFPVPVRDSQEARFYQDKYKEYLRLYGSGGRYTKLGFKDINNKGGILK